MPADADVRSGAVKHETTLPFDNHYFALRICTIKVILAHIGRCGTEGRGWYTHHTHDELKEESPAPLCESSNNQESTQERGVM